MVSFERYRLPYLILIVCLLFTGAVTYYLHDSTSTRDRLRFERLIERTQSTIEERVVTYIALLRATAGLFAVSDSVSRETFHAYVSGLDIRGRYPGIQGIGFTLRIPQENLQTIEQEMRMSGVSGFRVWPKHSRNEYYSIIYLEPLDDRNREAIGYDMFTHKVRRAAMSRARDTGRPAASGKVTLVQEIDSEKQAGFLIYYPVYRDGIVPATLEERRRQLLGFVYSPFRIGDLLNSILAPEYESAIGVALYDGLVVRPESLLHSPAEKFSAGSKEPRFRKMAILRLAERPWTLVFHSTPQFEAGSTQSWVRNIAAAGILISILLFMASRGQTKSRMEAEATAAELRQSEDALRRTENRARALVESNVIGIIVADLNGKILDANDTFLNLIGYTREDLRNGNIDWKRITPPEFAHVDEHAVQQLTRSGTYAPFEKDYLRKDGTRVPVLVGSSYLGEGVAVGFILDRSGAKIAEAALRESHNLLQAIIDGTNDAIFVKGLNGKYLMMNSACASLFNRSAAELIGKNDVELFGPELGEQMQRGDRKVLESGESQRFEDVVPTASGDLRIFQADKGFYRDAAGNILGIVGIARDITELKVIEKRLREQTDTLETVNRIGRLLSAELDRSKLIQAVTDATTVLANAEFGAFFVRSSQPNGGSILSLHSISGEGSELFAELEGTVDLPFYSFVFQEEQSIRVNDTMTEYEGPDLPPLSRVIRSFLAVPVISRSAEKIGGLLLAHSNPGRFNEREESIVGTIAAQAAIAIDNAQLFEASQRERTKAETLFKEVHHRVKNNMQIILSLLRLQSSHLTDSKSVEILADSRNRIKTMALIHEKLYQSDDLEKVNFDRYIEALTAELVRTYAVNSTKVDLALDCKEFYLNINTAVPLGLIVNELTSNALKYAFPNGGGKIEIQLRRNPEKQYRLTFADNGVGLPAQINVANSGTLGLRLVSMLVSQLQGSLQVDRKAGTIFHIDFVEQQ